MPTETQELLVFNCVVKHASFAKAADELNLSPSGVSRIVTRLEERLGARLVQRTTRKLALTEAGSAFHARSAQIMADLLDAEAEVHHTTLRPRGNLKLTASIMFGQLYMAPLMPQILARFPELSVELILTNRFVDLIDEGIDLAIRIGTLSDSRLNARRLCNNLRILVAAPSYLERCGVPQNVAELAVHEAVLFTDFAKPREWRLVGKDGPVTVGIAGRLATNNLAVLHQAATQGLGITVGATLSVQPALSAGELVRVLPDYQFEPSSIFAVFPSTRQLSTKVRAMVDFLVESFPDPPRWDRQLVGKVPGFG